MLEIRTEIHERESKYIVEIIKKLVLWKDQCNRQISGKTVQENQKEGTLSNIRNEKDLTAGAVWQ